MSEEDTQPSRRRHRSKALAAFRVTGLNISSQLAEKELLHSILEQAMDLLDASEGAVLYLYDPTQNLLRMVQAVGVVARFVGRTLAIGEGLAGRVFATGQPFFVDDYQHWEGRSPQYEGEPFTAILGAPLRWQGQLIGVLNVLADRQVRTFDADDAWLAEIFATQAAIVIGTRRLLDETRRTEERLADIALSAQDWLWEIDEQGRFSYSSGRVAEMLGYTSEEMIGHHWIELAAPSGQTGIETLLCLMGAGKPFTNLEVWLANRDGQPICLQVSGVPHHDQKGQLIGYRGAARDVTAQQETSRREQLAYVIGQRLMSVLALDELLDQFVSQVREALGYYHVHIRLFDPATQSLVVAAACGQGSDEMKARKDSIPLEATPSLNAQAARTMQAVISNAVRNDPHYRPGAFLRETRAEAVFPLFRGERLLGTLDVQSRQENCFDEAEVRTLQSLAAQVSIAIENARLFEALGQQAEHLEELVAERTAQVVHERERLDAIVESAGDGIFFTSPSGKIEYVNPAWERLTGYKASEVIGKRLSRLLGGQMSNGQGQELWQTIRRKEVWKGTLHLRRPDGSEYDATISLAPVLDARRRLINLVGVMRDVTAEKEVERMRTQFVANVSHELRTPITNLKIYHTLLRSAPAEKRSEYLDILATETNRLQRLVENLLDLSRIDRGIVQLNLQPTDLNALVQDVLRGHLPCPEGRDLDFELDLRPDLPVIQADREQMMQVLINLLMNAINYTTPGNRIGIRTRVDESGDVPQVALQVWDTGMGIAPQEIAFIFNRFFRTEAVRAAGIPGTGLGLSIVKEIVDLHNGQIEVESEPGKGTCFTILLPLSRENQERVRPGVR